MGYYSNFSFKINNPRIDEKKWEEARQRLSETTFEDVVLEIENGILKDISLEEYYGKFYEDEEFAEALSSILLDGSIDLFFVGEDGACWGWRITPGKYEELYNIWITREQYEKIKPLIR